MLIEKRGMNIKFLDKLPFSPDIVIGIGAEGCPHKCCSEISTCINSAKTNPSLLQHKYRLITPIIPEKYMDIVYDRVLEAVRTLHVESITVNDLGFLYKLSKNRDQFNHTDFILGRTLSKSWEYVPWVDKMLFTKDEELKKNILNPSILHKSKIEFFKTMHVSGVELCATPVISEHIETVKNYSMKVFMHYDTFVASVQRGCPVVRMHKCRAGRCENLCNDVIHLELDQIWGAGQLLYQTPTPSTMEIVPEYKCIENMVYFQKQTGAFPYEKCDEVIFDVRLHSDELISRFRDSENITS